MKPAKIHRQLQRIERAQCGFPDDTMGTGYELLDNSGHLDRALLDPNPDRSYVHHCAEELIRSALVLLVRQRRTLNLMVTGHAARLTLRHPDSAAGQLDHATQAILRWRIERQDRAPFGVAAIYDYWKSPTDDWITSFSLLTVNADDHPVMGRFHPPGDEKRSIVAIDPAFYDDWLKATTDEALSFFAPVDANAFTTVPDPKAAKVKSLPYGDAAAAE